MLSTVLDTNPTNYREERGRVDRNYCQILSGPLTFTYFVDSWLVVNINA